MGNQHPLKRSKSLHPKSKLKLCFNKDAHERYVSSSAQQLVGPNMRQKFIDMAKSNNMPSFSSDQRRLVFVSLIGLYSSWKKCPASVLSDAIFVLPLKRRWIYQPKKHKKEIQSHILDKINAFQEDETSLATFFEVLRWKDRQNLVFFILDDEFYDNKTKDETHHHHLMLIAPFWKRFSEKLATLQDPVTERNYMPLILNEDWWRTQYNRTYSSQFGVSPSAVLSELYFVTLKFKTMQEILYQSHRDSLLPIKFYDGAFIKPKLLLPAVIDDSKDPSDNTAAKDPPQQQQSPSEEEAKEEDEVRTNGTGTGTSSFTPPRDFFGYASVDNLNHDLAVGDEHQQHEAAGDHDDDDDDDDDGGQWVVSGDYMNDIDDHDADDFDEDV